MPVPTLITDLSPTISSNSPAGGDVPSVLDDHIRALAAFIAQLRNGSGFAAVRIDGATQGQVGTRAGGGSGTIAVSSFDDVVIDSGAASGVSILSGAASLGGIAFGDSGNANSGRLTYDHATDSMYAWTNATERYRIFSNGNISIGRATDAGARLLVDRLGSGTIPALAAGTSGVFAGCSSGSSPSAVSILSGNVGVATLNFADTDAEQQGRVQYDHAIESLSFWTNGVSRFNVSATGVTTFTNAVQCQGGMTSTSQIAYTPGAGGAVTQLTNKSTGVSLDASCGRITMSNAALAGGAAASFTVSNNFVGPETMVNVCIRSGAATGGSYSVQVDAVALTSFRISVRNLTGGNLSEALVLSFSVIGGADS